MKNCEGRLGSFATNKITEVVLIHRDHFCWVVTTTTWSYLFFIYFLGCPYVKFKNQSPKYPTLMEGLFDNFLQEWRR